jgi:hypothetical protein
LSPPPGCWGVVADEDVDGATAAVVLEALEVALAAASASLCVDSLLHPTIANEIQAVVNAIRARASIAEGDARTT